MSQMLPVPQEIALGEVLMPPLLVASVIGVVAATVTASVLNRVRLSRYLYHPPLVLVALTVLFTIAAGSLVVGI